MNGGIIFLLILIFLVILPAGLWVGYTRWRAHKQGLPAPPLSSYIPFYKSSAQSNYPIAPRPGGIGGWIQDKYQALKNRGTGLGSSRASGYDGSGRGRGAFAQLDPDGAWDDRVGHEADSHGRIGDYEEQELGIHPNSAGPYGGSGYGNEHGRVMPEYDEEPRGRSRGRDGLAYVGGSQKGLDQRYDEEMHAGGGQSERVNPFGDEAEPSGLRGVSPRPAEMDAGTSLGSEHGHKKKGSGDTHASSRKSMFQEGL